MSTPSSTIPGSWNAFQKFVFRYVFSYFSLCIFPFPFQTIPYLNYVAVPWNACVNPLISITSAYCFHNTPDWSHMGSGSGDQLLRYIEIASYMMISVPIAVIWSILDRKRREYSRLFAFLRLWSLMYVASTMLSYGASKIIPSQFPPLDDWRMVERVGDMSPMGMLWTFMSTSRAYTIFTGLAEFSAGVLLAIPSTTTLGALVSCAVCLQIFMLNMCYDVPVKLMSSHLLMLSLLVLSPELSNLFRAFVLHKASRPFQILKPFKRKILNFASWSFVWAYLLYTAVFAFVSSQSSLIEHHRGMGNTKLAGTWDVVTAQCDNPAQESYMNLWSSLSNVYKDNVTITTKSGQDIYLTWKFSNDGTGVDITSGGTSRWSAHFNLIEQDATNINLVGTMYGAEASLSLRKSERGRQYPLTERGFHWVNEVPYNR